MVDTDAARRQLMLSILELLKNASLAKLIIIQEFCKNIQNGA